MTSEAEVRIGEEMHVKEKGPLAPVVERVPKQKCGEQSREADENKKEESVVDHYEKENGEP